MPLIFLVRTACVGGRDRGMSYHPLTQVVLTLARHFPIAWRVSGGNWLNRIPSEGLWKKT